ncbi:hypothetical protein RvY_06025-1 [Ramazzottius varieornatus]|uniref:WAP domain-containing protein n=1 Tax=Ramazzottius varieornatus TaxID=947166 RepID=A0A1D1UX57_RAMVA|nr:hypothetical protein RvY_06025-1 [Ramazzottius varieornatus]
MGYSSSLGYYFVIGLVLGCCVCSHEGRTYKLPEKRSGLCPQPNCAMNVNCAPSYDCCDFGGSMFCVPAPCPPTAFCRKDSDCGPEEDKCCPTTSGRKVCAHAVFVV